MSGNILIDNILSNRNRREYVLSNIINKYEYVDTGADVIFNGNICENIGEFIDGLFVLFDIINEPNDIIIVILLYLKRLTKLSFVNKHNIYRILLTLISIAIKFVSDLIFSKFNSILSEMILMDLKELNTMEVILLNKLDYHLYYTLEEYKSIEDKVVNIHMSKCKYENK